MASLPTDLVESIFQFLHSAEPKHKINHQRNENKQICTTDEPQVKRSRWYQSTDRNSKLNEEFATKNDVQSYDKSVQPNLLNKARFTSPEHWELQQLAASGIIASTNINSSSSSSTAAVATVQRSTVNSDMVYCDLDETEYNVQLNRQEPSFLRGQTKPTAQFSPVRVVRNPQGSLLRAAQSSTSLVKATNPAASLKREMSPQRQSPLSNNEALSGPLPIEQYQDELVQLIRQHQILVVIGETGS